MMHIRITLDENEIPYGSYANRRDILDIRADVDTKEDAIKHLQAAIMILKETTLTPTIREVS